MSSNLSFKAAIVRKGLEDMEKKYYTKEDIIRTDFILENVFSVLVRDYYNFDAISWMNKKEKDVLEKIVEILNVFRDKFADPIKSLCREIVVINEDTVSPILLKVSYEVFAEGISWSRIIAFFAFVGELTITCIERKIPKSNVDVIYEIFSRLVKEKIESWIEDHDGWEGIKSVSVVTTSKEKLSTPSWSKHLLHLTNNFILNKFKKFLF